MTTMLNEASIPPAIAPSIDQYHDGASSSGSNMLGTVPNRRGSPGYCAGSFDEETPDLAVGGFGLTGCQSSIRVTSWSASVFVRLRVRGSTGNSSVTISPRRTSQ